VFESFTPTQFAAVFFRPTGSGTIDRVAEVARLNRDRGARGLRPVIPSWM